MKYEKYENLQGSEDLCLNESSKNVAMKYHRYFPTNSFAEHYKNIKMINS